MPKPYLRPSAGAGKIAIYWYPQNCLHVLSKIVVPSELPTCAVYDTMGCGVVFLNRVQSSVAAGDGNAEKGEKVRIRSSN